MSLSHIAIVVDDHPLVAKGIADFVRTCCGFSDAYAVPSAEALWQLLQVELQVAILIVDFWLPSETALALIPQFKHLKPGIPVLVMSADDRHDVQSSARTAGADGFILKQEDTQFFARALTTLLTGGSHFYSPELFEFNRSMSERAVPVTAAELGLTPRQAEVLSLVLDGKSNKRIANALGLSEPTIKEHISAILEKLGVHNRIEAITKLRGRILT